jgi:hypothetical protein
MADETTIECADEKPFYRSRKWLGAAVCSLCWLIPYMLAVLKGHASAGELANAWGLVPLVWTAAIGGQSVADAIRARRSP